MYSSFDHDVALAGFHGEGGDLVGELASLLGGFGLVLRGDGEFVLRVAADLPFLGDVLSGLAHVIAVEGVPKTVLDHRVDQFQVAHLLTGADRLGVHAHRHVFLATGGHDFGVAQLDVLCAKGNGAKARATNLVDAPGRGFLRQTGVDVGLTGGVLALTGGQNLTEDGFRTRRICRRQRVQRRLPGRWHPDRGRACWQSCPKNCRRRYVPPKQ